MHCRRRYRFHCLSNYTDIFRHSWYSTHETTYQKCECLGNMTEKISSICEQYTLLNSFACSNFHLFDSLYISVHTYVSSVHWSVD